MAASRRRGFIPVETGDEGGIGDGVGFAVKSKAGNSALIAGRYCLRQGEARAGSEERGVR